MSELNKDQGQEAQGPIDAEALAEAEFAAAFSEAAGAADSDAEPGTGAEEDKAGQGEEGQGAKPVSAGNEATGENGAGAGAEPSAEDDAEAMRRKAQLYDAEQGRLRQTQDRLRQAQEELKNLRASGAGQADAVGKPLAEVPEDIREDVEAFAKAKPKYAAFMAEDSGDGERLRKALAEYGPDHVIVEEMADRIADKRGRLNGTVAAVEQAAADLHEAHFAVIHTAHPDYGALQSADMSVPENKAKLDAYKARVDAWAEAKPGKDYVEIQRIRTEGTAQEVCALLSRFKEETGPKARQEKTRQAAEAALAPPSRPSPTPVVGGGPDKDDFEAGWKAGVKITKK